MSICMQIKKCPKCGKKYSFNPDVGNFQCPHCHGLGKVFPDKRKKEKGFEEKIR